MYDYFRAADDEAAKGVGRVVGGPAVAGHPGVIETKWVEPHVRVGQLYFRALGREWHYDAGLAVQVLPEEPIGPDNFEEPTLERLSDEVRDTLAGLSEEQRAALGRWWSTSEEFTRDRTDPAYVEELCAQLVMLCRDARDHHEHVYVWGCL
jgi:hypothetical protein